MLTDSDIEVLATSAYNGYLTDVARAIRSSDDPALNVLRLLDAYSRIDGLPMLLHLFTATTLDPTQ